MLQYSTFSVISPEGCASILWKDAKLAAEAAEAMGVTSEKVHKAGLIDSVIGEPLGGAHRDPDLMAAVVKKQLLADLHGLQQLDVTTMLEQRYQKLMAYGVNAA